MALRKGFRQLLVEAQRKAPSISVQEAHPRLGDPGTLFVDIRDVRELKRDGMIPGAYHAPRGMLEFWVDPDSPYYKDVFGSGKRFVLYCASGWRSALATDALKQMGLDRVAHIEGGFNGWKQAGGPVAQRAKKG